MAHKVKITRKQIKQDDKFLAAIKGVTRKVIVTTTDRTWLEKNRTILIACAAALLLVVVGVGVYFGVNSWQRRGAEKLMAQADAIYRAPVVTAEELQKNRMLRSLGAYTEAGKKWSDAAAAYDRLSTAYPRSQAGLLAAYYAGNCYYDLKKYDDAIARYQDYLAKAGANAPFAAFARQSVGYAYEAEGKLKEAETAFQGLTADASETTAFLSLFDLARILEKEQQWDRAIATLKKVDEAKLEQGPQMMEFKRQADVKIAALEARRGSAS